MFSDRALARISSVLPDVAVKSYGRYQSALYKLSGGRLAGRYGRGQVLRLTTTGRRSGTARSTALLYGQDGPRLVLVGSNRGSNQHPAWALNLLANPEAEVQIGRKRRRVLAREVTGEERTRLWPLMSEIYEGFDVYNALTERDLKVFVLESQRLATKPIGSDTQSGTVSTP